VGLGVLGWLVHLAIQMGGVEWLAAANRWLATNVIEKLGYAGVFALMFIESSLIPFPSEIIIPPAGDLARRLPDWSLAGVITMGVLGSLAGGFFNYGLARYLGRPVLMRLIERYGRFVRLSPSGYQAAERFFDRHGEISTFTGRLIPGVRQIISLPAGLAGMNLFTFSLFTALGAGIWVVVLALVGYWFGSEPEALKTTLRTYSLWLVGGAMLVVGAYVVILHWRRRTGHEVV
jgi:membrane protein DedA with SNARE-associated domain